MSLRHVRVLSALSFLVAASSGVACSGGDEATGSTSQAVSRSARLYLTDAVIQGLQARAAAGDPAWTALKGRCDGLASGQVNDPSGPAYADYPNIGQGYQGENYLPEIMNLGLCYRVSRGVDAAAEARYAAAGVRVLEAMSTPVGSGGQAPRTDDGYGIRNYGVGMATGFDWLYPALSDGTKQRVIASLNTWMDWYDASGFSRNDPIGNYFMGYLLAKTTTAIATEGDNPKAAGYWADVASRMWGQLVKPKFSAWMAGGGWPEGWQYGPLSVQNFSQFLWAAKTGKGVDWWSELPQARDQAEYITHFAWPSLKHMDDQGTIHSGDSLKPSAAAVGALAAMMQYNGDAYASVARSFASELAATNNDAIDAWQKFLYWDTSLGKTAYTGQRTSYFAKGPNHVAMRSSWAKDAVWGSFASGQYINAPDSGEQYFNQGSLVVVSGDSPILVNATGWLPQVGGSPGEELVYQDTWDDRTRLLNNTFFAAGAKQDSFELGQSNTHVEKFEDGGAWVRAKGVNIQDMYAPAGVVSQFTRDIAYVRPGVFVVHDRTASSAGDQWMSWHTPVAATKVGADRFDVGSVGSIRTLLPSGATTRQQSILGGAVHRLEVHSSAPSQQWLTVVTAGAAPAETRLSAADGNASGSMLGVHVQAARGAVVLFNAAAGDYTVAQGAEADHVLFDLPAGGYGVSTSVAGGKVKVTVTAGGPLTATANGTLHFVIKADGSVANAAPQPPPPSGGGSGSTPPPSGGGSGSGTGGTDPTTPPAAPVYAAQTQYRDNPFF